MDRNARIGEAPPGPLGSKIVYVISERGAKRFWTRIGVAWTNADGSLQVKLEAVPVNGEMQIRDYVRAEQA